MASNRMDGAGTHMAVPSLGGEYVFVVRRNCPVVL